VGREDKPFRPPTEWVPTTDLGKYADGKATKEGPVDERKRGGGGRVIKNCHGMSLSPRRQARRPTKTGLSDSFSPMGTGERPSTSRRHGFHSAVGRRTARGAICSPANHHDCTPIVQADGSGMKNWRVAMAYRGVSTNSMSTLPHGSSDSRGGHPTASRSSTPQRSAATSSCSRSLEGKSEQLTKTSWGPCTTLIRPNARWQVVAVRINARASASTSCTERQDGVARHQRQEGTRRMWSHWKAAGK